MSRKRTEFVPNPGAVTLVGVVLCFFLFSNINCGDNGIDDPHIIADDSEVMWTTNGVAVRNVDGSDAEFPRIVSDGSGDAIITWNDYRDGFDTGIYAQRLDSEGNALWTANGIAVRQVAGSSATNQQITTDGAGGAIITWEDERSGSSNIYTQRVDSGGTAKWTANGVLVCNVAGSQLPQIVADGSGGAIITWIDGRSTLNEGVYAQRVDAGGKVLWAANGVAICNADWSEAGSPQITSDGSGGAIITWEDSRNGETDIFANRVDADGGTHWPTQGSTSGVAVRQLSGSDARLPQIATDGAGGAIITWNDQRNGDANIYANRVDAGGITQWPAEGSTSGVAICQVAVDLLQAYPMVSDNAGGAIITWQDKRSGDSNIYAQRMDSDGNIKWSTNGVAIRQMTGSDASLPQITADGIGGAIIAWVDQRRSNALFTHQDIYAQGIDLNGNARWAENGIVVRGAPLYNLAAWPSITKDGSGGAIITWSDGRSLLSGYDNIYAQRTSSNATVTDIDGNVYYIVKMGDQFWLRENLKVTHYNNGDSIPNVTDNTKWTELTSGAYCNYDNDETHADTYGRLYNWYAGSDERNICPEGWHIPTESEWNDLVNHLGGEYEAGGKLKEEGTSHWESPNAGATNESGFTGLPGGIRVNDGSFEGMHQTGIYWSSTKAFSGYGASLELYYDDSTGVVTDLSMFWGLSARCIKD